MRILFNTTAALEGTSGFTQTVELVGALRRLPDGHDYVVLTTRSQTDLRDAVGSAVEHVVIDAPGGGARRTLALWAELPALLTRAGVDALYNRGNFYAPRVRATQICLIENANPFSHLSMPQSAGARARNVLLRCMSEAALRYAAAVVFPSDTAYRTIVRGRTMGARPFVIPHGAEMPPAGMAPRPVPEPYLLAVTSLFPFKNLAIALRALALLRATGAFRGRLLIVGDAGPESYARELRREIASLGLESAVHIHPAVPRADLSAWYRHAELALITSLEETFGLPVVEAMGMGTPVVASDCPPGDRYFVPFRELCGDAAEYFDPFEAASCALAIERALAEPRRTEMIAQGLARTREYTWDAAARRTSAMLTELAASRNCSDNATSGTTGTTP